MAVKKGNIFSIKKFAVHDGPGIRTTVFFSGCQLNCLWCHNPESRGACDDTIRGEWMDLESLIVKLERDVPFYDESEGGVTVSGGEPFVQGDFLEALLMALKGRDIHTVLDTTGYTDSESFRRVAAHVDLFLYDLKLINDLDHIRFTGVSNQQILQNFDFLNEAGKPAWVRFPLIPTMTDRLENITGIGEMLADRNNIQRLSILPFHRIGSHKYQKLGTAWEMDGIEAPEPSEIERVAVQFRTFGLNVVIGVRDE